MASGPASGLTNTAYSRARLGKFGADGAGPGDPGASGVMATTFQDSRVANRLAAAANDNHAPGMARLPERVIK